MRFPVAPTLWRTPSGDGGTAQTLGRISVDVTVGGIELNARGLKTKNVHIDLASTRVAAARHGDLGAMEATQQGSHHGCGSTHLGNELVGASQEST